MITKNLPKLLIVVLIFTNLSCATLSRESEYYGILKEIKTSEPDYAFMKLKNYLKGMPDSVHAQEIRFALCEYYFQTENYRDAINELSAYLIDYPDDKSTIFVQAILYKALLKYKEDSRLLEKLKERFFAKSLFLVFSESKIKHYKSILNNTYKISEYVDKIEFFKNNDPFLKITP